MSPLPNFRASALGLAALCLCVPAASGQQYAVPAGEPILLNGGDYGGAYGGNPQGEVVGPTFDAGVTPGQSFYGPPDQFASGPVPSGQFSSGQFPDGLPPGVEVIGGPGVAGHAGATSQPAYQTADGGFGGGYVEGYGDEYAAYGGEVFPPDLAAPVVSQPVYGGTVCGDAYGCDAGCDTSCAPGCDTSAGCGGPVVCNKFGRCGKFYNVAARRTRCGLSAGYTFLFLRPRLDTATSAVVSRPTANGTATFAREQEFDDLETGSRIYVELIRPDAWGFRVTYSGVEADADPLNVAVPDGGRVTSAAAPSGFTPFTVNPNGAIIAAGEGNRLTTAYEVEFDNFDMEATRRLRAADWLLNVGGGVRFASLEQTYDAFASGDQPGSATSASDFEGSGPTVFAEFRRPIGQTGLAFLTSARGSLIYGEREGFARTSQGGVTNTAVFESDDLVPLGEIQIGGEWSAWVNPATLFFTQAAFETHLWSGVGSAHDPEGDVGFSGFNLTLGLEW